MPMQCPQCGQERSFKKNNWTAAQRRHYSPSVGGRNYCVRCYEQGPTEEDYKEISDWLSKITQWSAIHHDNKYPWQSFMASFLRRMDAHTRKEWSNKGLLPLRVATDYVTNHPRGHVAFDPRNVCYAIVIRREAPSLAKEMSWTGGVSDELCGDCIESLMAAAQVEPHERGPELEGLADEEVWHEANSFFTEYSYAVWRIYRVKTWHEDTVNMCGEQVQELLERVDACFSARDCFRTEGTLALPGLAHPPVPVAASAGECTPADLCDCVEPEVSVESLCPRCGFPSTMVCSCCQFAGCGLCIIFSYNSRVLLCIHCRMFYDGSSPAALSSSNGNSGSSRIRAN